MADALLDSDVVIWCLRGRQETIHSVRALTEDGLPACSALSVLEVELGMKKGEEEATFGFLDSLRVVPVTKAIAREAAAYIRRYEARGRKIDFVDAVIAATCLLEGFRLVTYNMKHYPMTDFEKSVPS